MICFILSIYESSPPSQADFPSSAPLSACFHYFPSSLQPPVSSLKTPAFSFHLADGRSEERCYLTGGIIMTHEEARARALELLGSAGVVFLGTNGSGGVPWIKAMLRMENEGLERSGSARTSPRNGSHNYNLTTGRAYIQWIYIPSGECCSSARRRSAPTARRANVSGGKGSSDTTPGDRRPGLLRRRVHRAAGELLRGA